MNIDSILKAFGISHRTDTAAIVLTALLLIIVAALCFFCVKYLHDNNMVKKLTEQAYLKMSDAEKRRMDEAERTRMKIGENNEGNFLDRLDKQIIYSGIKRKIKFFSTDLLLIGYAVMFGLLIILSDVIFHNVLYGIIVGASLITLGQCILVVCVNRQYKLVQDNIIKFLNIIENFAATSNDLITILERTAGYLENPLKDMLLRCVAEARGSGDRRFALIHLQDEIQNSYFKELIRALRIGSNYEANYAEIIEDSRETIQKSLKYEEEKETIKKNGRVDMLVLLAVGCVCALVSSEITEMTLIQLFTQTGLGGFILLVYMVIVVLVIIYLGFIKSLNK